MLFLDIELTFPHKVKAPANLISNVDGVKEMEDWCAQEFGPPYLLWEDDKLAMTKEPVINRDGQWCLFRGKFWFLDEKAAILYKLRWF